MKKNARIPGLIVALLPALLAARLSVASDTYNQDFNSWSTAATYGIYTNAGWVLYDGYVASSEGRLDNVPGPYVMSPLLTNGIGTVSWKARKRVAGDGDQYFDLQKSTNGTAWTTLGSYTNSSAAYTLYSPSISMEYTPAYLRLFKRGQAATGNLMFDDVAVTRAPASVVITNVFTTPAAPRTSDSVQVAATIQPRAGANNISATVFYRSASGAAFSSVAMQSIGGFGYLTTGYGIPALSPAGAGVEYYIRATYQGGTGTSTNYYPSGAPANLLRYSVKAISPFGSMRIAGTQSTNMLLVADNQWQGVIVPSGTLSNPVFYFNSGATNWGDFDQSVSNRPVYGVAELGGSNIRVSGSVTNTLSFLFRDSYPQDYSIQNAFYMNFDKGWPVVGTYGQYTNSGWVISGAAVSSTNASDTVRAFIGRYCMLKFGLAGGNQYVRSPYLAEGIGTLSFRYRHRDDPTSPAAGFRIQKSVDGLSGWTDIGQVTNVHALGFVRYNASFADKASHYVRIFNNTPPAQTNSWLCLDEIVVTAPGASVELYNPGRTPATPALGRSVNVSIDIKSATGGATNLQCSLYFRYTNDLYWATSSMSRGGNTFSATIPPSPPGIMSYYFYCTYTGFGASPARYPTTGTLTYTNPATLASNRSQNFNAWSASSYGVWTNAGWVLYDGLISSAEARLRNTTGAYLRSPYLTNGVGTVSWTCHKRVTGDSPDPAFALQVSFDGSAWTTVNSYTNSSTAVAPFSLTVTNSAVHYIRLIKTDGSYLQVDDVTVSFPYSDVRISSIFFAPGYPASNENVNVSCLVDSTTPGFSAYGITPQVYHRLGTSGTWNVTFLSRGFTNVYSGSIPAYAPGTVQYYIRCDFGGNYYTAAERQSPAFSPDAPATTNRPSWFYTYDVRAFQSDYQYLSVTGNFGTATMQMTGNDMWQGVIDPAGTNRLTISFHGYNRYTGYGYSPYPDDWGVASQSTTALPLPGTTIWGGSDLVVEGNFSGLVIVQYDLTHHTFIVKQGAFQDFNQWRGSRDYFEESLGNSALTVYSLNFDSMPRNYEYVTKTGPEGDLEDFQNPLWPSNYCSTATVRFPAGWYVLEGTVVHELGGNVACELNDSPTTGKNWEYRSYATEGLKQFDFRYRAFDSRAYPTRYQNGTAWNNYSVTAHMFVEHESPMWPYLSMFVKYIDDNNYYEYRLARKNLTQVSASIWKKKNGVGPTKLTETGNITDSLDGICRLTCVTNNAGRFLLESTYEGGNTLRYYDTDPITGAGSIGFNTMEADFVVDDINATSMNIQRFENWSQANTGTYVQADWTINSGRPVNGDYCELQPKGFIKSPQLSYNVGTLTFQYRDKYSGGTPRARLLGSANGAAPWTVLYDISDFTNTAWKTWNQSVSFGSNRYLMWTNYGADQIQFQDIYITAATNFYAQDFSSGTAPNWTPASPRWYVQNGAYKRPGYIGPAINYDIQLAPTNSVDPTGPSEGAWSTAQSLVASNLTYMSTTVVTKAWARKYIRIRHTTGQANLWVDDLKQTSWRATNNSVVAPGWQLQEGWIGLEGLNNNRLELWRSRADPNIAQSLRTPWMTSVGDFRFNFKTLNGPATFKIEAAFQQSSPVFTLTLATVTTNAPAWQEYVMTLNTNRAMYVRINHVSTDPNTILYIDNASVTDYQPRDDSMWTAYNALITYTQDTREFERFKTPETDYRTCYLNNSTSAGTQSGTILKRSNPYVQSPKMPLGIGEISFWYRSWQDNGTPPGKITLLSTHDPVPESSTNWTPIGTISNIRNAQYTYYTTNVFLENERFLRISAETNATSWARVCMDNVTIGQPIGANFSVQDFHCIPAVPLQNDEVRFSATLGNFFWNPTNIQLRVYYTVGSNTWVNWDSSDYVPLTLVSNGPSQRYETPVGYGIPPKSVDTLVQYRLACFFDGDFSFKSSPKLYREFANPSWYAPVDLNAAHSVTNPYYFVFSCLPRKVWPNEINPARNAYDYTNEYVELCGPAGTDISKWKIQLVDPYLNVYDQARVPNSTILPNTTANGWGFFVYGDPGVHGVGVAFTNPVNNNIQLEGGVRLIRSMGAYEYQLCFGSSTEAQNMQNDGFEYIGAKSYSARRSPFFLTGSGTDYTNFQWQIVSGTPGYTPGAANPSQTLLYNLPPSSLQILITDFWVDPTNAWLVFTGTNNMGPTTWYSTNLYRANPWLAVTNAHTLYGGGVYTQWFSRMTNSPTYFYRVVATNAP